MSASPTRRLQAVCDVLDVHDQHHRMLDGRLIALAGPLGQIRPFHGELRILIERRTSAALVRRLLGIGVIDVASNGNLRVTRTPRADEAAILRDLLGFARRRWTP